MPESSPQSAPQGCAVQRPYDRRARTARRRAFRPTGSRSPRKAIADALANLHVGPDDLCICGGACGGDLLFAEAALGRSALLEIYIPFEEPTFLEKSVDFANKDWRTRFFAAKARSALHVAARRTRPTAKGREPLRAREPLDARRGATLRRGQGRSRLSLEWRGRRRARRRAAHDGRSSQQGRPNGLARHKEAVGLSRAWL